MFNIGEKVRLIYENKLATVTSIDFDYPLDITEYSLIYKIDDNFYCSAHQLEKLKCLK